MSISNNTTYNKVVTTALLATALSAPFIHADMIDTIDTSFLPIVSYDKSIDYSIEKQSTIDNSNIKNNIEMLRLLEIDELNNEIKLKFGTIISDTWIPADGILDKCCLFIELNNQENLVASSKNFELDLYLALEEKIDKSNFFDMIALI